MTWRAPSAVLCLTLGIVMLASHEHPAPPFWKHVIVNAIGCTFLAFAVVLTVKERERS